MYDLFINFAHTDTRARAPIHTHTHYIYDCVRMCVIFCVFVKVFVSMCVCLYSISLLKGIEQGILKGEVSLYH